MQHYVGLDVSVKETSVCIVDKAGKVMREVKVPSLARNSSKARFPLKAISSSAIGFDISEATCRRKNVIIS
jgi:predicted NBD/HSP70 family sugar kinase